MKKLFLLLTACLALTACGSGEKGQAADTAAVVATDNVEQKDYVEVLSFHSKYRCPTCIAIEKNTRELVDAKFGDALKSGDLVMRVVDISKDENKAIAEKYEVTWSSLLVVKYKDGQETYENLTDFAFGHARKSPEDFKAGVVEAINAMLQ